MCVRAKCFSTAAVGGVLATRGARARCCCVCFSPRRGGREKLSIASDASPPHATASVLVLVAASAKPTASATTVTTTGRRFFETRMVPRHASERERQRAKGTAHMRSQTKGAHLPNKQPPPTSCWRNNSTVKETESSASTLWTPQPTLCPAAPPARARCRRWTRGKHLYRTAPPAIHHLPPTTPNNSHYGLHAFWVNGRHFYAFS